MRSLFHALIPLALRGVKYRPIGASALLRRNLLIYGLGGDHCTVYRDKTDRSVVRTIHVMIKNNLK